MTGNTPVSVLRSIARHLGCGYPEIEAVLVKNLGGQPMKQQDDPFWRLDAIRKKLGVGEGQCVVEAAGYIAPRIK